MGAVGDGAVEVAPAGLAAEVSGLAELISSVQHDGRSGWKTTEFWVSITTWLLPILTLVWHRDFSSLATPLAVVAAGGAQAVYTISRAITKKGHATAIASMVTASPAMLAVASSAAPAAPVAPSVSGATGAGAALGAPATGPQALGPAGSAGPAGLAGADGAQLIQAVTAALQALTAAVEKLSA